MGMLSTALDAMAGRHATKIRFLLVGGWNTAFGYGISLITYSVLEKHIHVILILTLSNVISITNAFLLYKLLVFKTQGNWLSEYLRSYLSYGITALGGIFLVWILVDFLGFLFWTAQGLAIASFIPISFLFHKRFTFIR